MPAIVRTLFTLLLVLIAPSVLGAAEIDAAKLFHDIDANADGQLAAGEVGDAQQQLFKRLVRTGDENDDGRLTAEEFATALQPVRAEKSMVEKQGSRLPGADALTVLLAKMDSNHDRRIESDEVPDAYRRVFEQFLRPGDDDKDGNLSMREIGRSAPRLSNVAAMAAWRTGLDVPAELAKLPAAEMSAIDQMDAYARPVDAMADPAQAQDLFRRLDANGDDHLVAEEAPGPFADRFNEMVRRGDEDGDERLSRKEFMAMSRRLAEFESAKPEAGAVRRAYRQLLNRFDADGDGQLSVREAPPRIAENFDRADGDANGVLDRTELTRVAETMARMQTFVGGRTGRPTLDDSRDRPRKKNAAKAKNR